MVPARCGDLPSFVREYAKQMDEERGFDAYDLSAPSSVHQSIKHRHCTVSTRRRTKKAMNAAGLL